MAHPELSPTHHTHDREAVHAATIGVNKIGIGDLRDALARGYDDFLAKPSHLVFLCIIYPIAGLVLCRLAFGYDVLPLIYPMIAGFALLGPFAAIGLYEISRRRELGEDVSWRHALDVFRSTGIGAIMALGGALVVIFIVWLAVADMIYSAIFGAETPQSLGGFVSQVFTTRQGLELIVVGNLAGVIFGVVAFAISVVSFPLILDRHVDIVTAISTSVRAVARNPVTMAMWAFIVAAGLALGISLFFVGLALVMPILGHATWHLYRKVVQS